MYNQHNIRSMYVCCVFQPANFNFHWSKHTTYVQSACKGFPALADAARTPAQPKYPSLLFLRLNPTKKGLFRHCTDVARNSLLGFSGADTILFLFEGKSPPLIRYCDIVLHHCSSALWFKFFSTLILALSTSPYLFCLKCE